MSIQIKVQNIGAIRAVAIDTGERVVTKVAGKNGAGKSTVLKIFDYLADTRSIPPEPIRQGEDKGEAEVWFDSDEGRIVAKLKFSQANKRGTLSIQTEHGRPIRNPKEFLKSVFGPFSFNPVTFMDMPEREQMETLVRALNPEINEADLVHAMKQNGLPNTVGLDANMCVHDFDESGIEYLERSRKAFYDWRRNVNYEVDDARKRIPADWTPSEEQVAPPNIADLLDAQRRWTEYYALCDEGNAALNAFDEAVGREKALRDELAKAQLAVEYRRKKVAEIESRAEALKSALPSMTEDEIRVALADAERVTKARHEHEDRVEQYERWRQASELSGSITGILADLDALKRTRLAESAKAIGIEDLEIREDGILYRGLPLKQACGTAEGIILSFRIMAALNPSLRLLRIDDANLLSPSSVEIVESIAAEHGYQVLMAYVDDDGSEGGIYIEDGEVIADTYGGAE